MMFMHIAAAARESDPYELQYPQLYNPFNQPISFQVATPLSYPRPQVNQPTQTQQAGPSDLERLIGGLFQVAGALAVGYVKFIVVPQLKAEVDAELKEAARDERMGDFAALLLFKYGLNKASGN